MYRLHEAFRPAGLSEASRREVSASDQPMEMRAMVEFAVDKKGTQKMALETTFVINEPIDAVERGSQMQQAVTAFVAGFVTEAGE